MKAEFILSAAGAAQFITDSKPKICFVGRSNVGKSSVINSLTGRRSLAKVGNAPGKTTHANYFLIDDQFYFIDLPGYGYAKVSHSERARWGDLMELFFDRADELTLSVQVVDARHEPSKLDVQMAQYFQQLCLPWMVLANKSDKLKKNQLKTSLDCIRRSLTLDTDFPLFPFSGEKGTGKEDVLGYILNKLR